MLKLKKFRRRTKKKKDNGLNCYHRVMTQNTTIVCRLYGLQSIESCVNCKYKNKVR